ncbi:hypothetical protein TorRG33x02_305440, partial [Trema orientale]
NYTRQQRMQATSLRGAHSEPNSSEVIIRSHGKHFDLEITSDSIARQERN